MNGKKVQIWVNPQEQHLIEVVRKLGWGTLNVIVKYNGIPVNVSKPVEDIRLRETFERNKGENPKEDKQCQTSYGRLSEVRGQQQRPRINEQRPTRPTT